MYLFNKRILPSWKIICWKRNYNKMCISLYFRKHTSNYGCVIEEQTLCIYYLLEVSITNFTLCCEHLINLLNFSCNFFNKSVFILVKLGGKLSEELSGGLRGEQIWVELTGRIKWSLGYWECLVEVIGRVKLRLQGELSWGYRESWVEITGRFELSLRGELSWDYGRVELR
jgi:hypothetical protein